MKQSPAAHELLTAAQIAALRRRSDGWGIALVVHAWAVIAMAMAAAVIWSNPLVWLLSGIVIGSRQLGLLILMHDAAHGILARTPWLNTMLGQGLCAWPMLADQHAYRRYHLRHHAHTLQAGDPDLVLTGHYPISRVSLRRKLLRDLSGQTGLAQRRGQFAAALGSPDQPMAARIGYFLRILGPAIAANLTLFGILSALGYWQLYPLLWLLPALTWHQAVLRIRNIAEHAVVPDPSDPFQQARTTHANGWMRALVAPYWVNFHLEHHLCMWVPCYRLPQMARDLVANGHAARCLTSSGYLSVLKQVTTCRNDAAGGGGSGGLRPRANGTFSDGFADGATR